MNAPSPLSWTENDTSRTALWRSDQVMPKHVVLADDTLSADTAYRLACAGTGLLWRGDFQNARQMLQALTRRIDKPKKLAPKNQTAMRLCCRAPLFIFTDKHKPSAHGC